MRLFVVTAKHGDAARAVAGEGTVRVVEPGDGVAALREGARLPADVLVLDVATGPGLGAALTQWQIARPNCRVMILAAGREPGDPDVGAMVSAGVYDVLQDLAGLEEVLARPKGTIANAVAWLPRGLSPEAAEPKVITRTVVQREVVERERVIQTPMASHPLVVAVVGLCGGCGATVTAAAVGGWLVHQRQDVILIGRGPAVMAQAMGLKYSGDGYSLRPAVATPGDTPVAALALDAVAARRWAWVVVDAGQVGGERKDWIWPEAVAHANITLLIVPAGERRMLEHAPRWPLGVAAAKQARVAVRWHPRDGKAGLEYPMRVLLGDGDTQADEWSGQRALPVPDLEGAMQAGWPLGARIPSVRLDRAARAMLAPHADHLGSRRG